MRWHRGNQATYPVQEWLQYSRQRRGYRMHTCVSLLQARSLFFRDDTWVSMIIYSVPNTIL